MSERAPRVPGASQPILQLQGLNVFYGRSHALQGVDLTLHSGVLSVVGRNGMGKTTMCKTIMGLVKATSGSIRFMGEELLGRTPAEIARKGIGYVPQGRRLWRSLTVDEHLRLMSTGKGSWTPERIYEVFPRLAERRRNGGGQLSGGEQQMLAISRALLMNPKLLIMDEPTEGLAPVIVAHVEETLVRLADEGDVSILVIEQNIGVATQMSDPVAIMVNGRIHQVIASQTLAADRDLQQRLLGVGRHSHDETDVAAGDAGRARSADPAQPVNQGPIRVYNANPTLPTRWSQDIPAARIEAAARTISRPTLATIDGRRVGDISPLAARTPQEPHVIVAGTLDTKGDELRYIRDIIKAAGLRTRLVDLSTNGRNQGADVSAQEVALASPKASAGIASGDRGTAVAAMTEAFRAWVERQQNVAGIIAAGGSGGTAIATAGMQVLPFGVPKIMISTMAAGNVAAYVGPTDITMMHSVTDVQGLNRVSRAILGNGAHAMTAMARGWIERQASRNTPVSGLRPGPERPLVGLTMFGVTTPCVQQVTKLVEPDWEPLVFHATGIGGRSMEKLIDSGLLQGVIDVSTTEICDMMMGGLLPATDDRFGAVIRTRLPYVGSVGALDMVNFAAPDTVPAQYRGRLFYPHNPQITLMRTTVEENRRMGRWIGERLNQMEGPVRFLIPEGGISALDAPGKPFWDPAADDALFSAIAETFRTTANRQLIRLPHHINDPAFAAALVQHFRSLHQVRARGSSSRT